MELISERYNLIITPQAQNDIDDYIETITYMFDAPRTAKKHYDGLYEVFRTIQKYPESFSIRYNKSLLQYGFNVRRVNYKKMAIIYTIHNDIVYIHRIIASSMITGL